MFHYPEQFRFQTPNSVSRPGHEGAFQIPLPAFNSVAIVMASEVGGWEHVAVHVVENGQKETPTWEEMCAVKALFWSDEDCVIEYLPPRATHVDATPHTLHLWRPVGVTFPVPSPEIV